ncbi:hypothetical protein Q5O14_12695 [Eubacteriaceae bacterium ES2]|nr:hypothetical protein Q5O14_12695 [Eubacteriaceae bacterium ES2]
MKIQSYSLPYQEYGFIEGEINNIDIDSTAIQNSDDSYYKAEILLENNIFKGNNEKEAELKIGMPIEGQIIIDKKSFLRIFLEKIELWINN